MSTKSTPVLATAALLLAAGISSAQVFFAPYERTFFQDRIGLLQQEQVRQELKLEPGHRARLDAALRPIREKYATQIKELQKLPVKEANQKYDKLRTAIQQESHKAIKASLRPRQLERLLQIERQEHGAKAFDDPEVQKALALSQEQKTRIKEIAGKAQQEKSRAMRTTGLSSQAMQQIDKKQLADAVAVLTEKQKKIWHELVGDPFTLRPGRR